MKKVLACFILLCMFTTAWAQTPEVYSWIRNTTGSVGYNNIPSNVQHVYYTTTDVYVKATCIPDYPIGPWNNNPNIPVNKNFTYKITRNPIQNTGTPTNVGLGHTGVWTNGVSVFNAKDGMSYNNAGVWNRDALFYEGVSFDNCLGHPAPGGEYHHHVNPTCLYDDTDSTHHSPIIGYALDGFPIYGAYAYTNTNGTGAIKRMQSGFVLSSATTRVNGPAVNTLYPNGCFIEDNIYTAGSGDLDAHNGRFCITPEYPLGIYAYFVTINANLYPVYPYTTGLTYYGTVQAGNTGPQGANNTVPTNAIEYTGTTGLMETIGSIDASISPNPCSNLLTLRIANVPSNNISAKIYNAIGSLIADLGQLQANSKTQINCTQFSKGLYIVVVNDGSKSRSLRWIKE